MLFQHFDWDLAHQVLFLYIYFPQPSYELEIPALENAHTLVQRTDISVNVSLMLDNPFLVPSLCKLNHISVCFIQISTKWPVNSLFPIGKVMFFWSYPRCFGPFGKFQLNKDFYYDRPCFQTIRFLWLWWNARKLDGI